MEETGFKDEVDGAMARDCSKDSTADQTAEEDLSGAAKEAALGTGSESAPPLKAPLICCAEGLDKDTFKVCKEVLRPFKSSLRKLNLSQHHLMKKRLKHVKESLAITGNCIDRFLHKFCRASEVARWQKKLWQFVSLFSELEADQLEKMYVCIKKNQMDKFQQLCCPSETPCSEEELNWLYTRRGLQGGTERPAGAARSKRQSPSAQLPSQRPAAGMAGELRQWHRHQAGKASSCPRRGIETWHFCQRPRR
ncbi:CHD1 helical C-terminal domain containing protein 1 isoform X1 [Pezoporus occidentalis]|uniref:CHD1 helical C-terminal domain containing protein 1 isoform X1 n=1 Tax=Pezoporus occidentalis TaxID=407982 RepID=UPI002F915D9A